MGFWLLGPWCKEDAAIIEEIARVHKLDIDAVEKEYDVMLKTLKKENKNEIKA